MTRRASVVARPVMGWAGVARGAVIQLQRGETVHIRARGTSMRGRVEEGELVTIEPCDATTLATGDIVLVEIQGKRRTHVVLHQILACEPGRVLVGSARGRVDGWVNAGRIHGRAIASCDGARSGRP